jgi:hypothetical protein
MKRLLLLLCLLLLPVAVEARMNLGIVGGGAAAPSCDSCTGTLVLSHHFEAESCETGTPCGCSTNATKTITLGTDAGIVSTTGTNWPSDGTNSLSLGTTATTIPITWDKTVGTVSFDVYCSTFAGNVNVLYFGNLGDGDYVKVALLGSDDNNKVYLTLRSDAGASVEVASAMTAFTGPKVSITAKWDTTTAHSTNYLSLTVDAATVTGTVQPTAVVGTFTTLNVGVEASSVCYVDNLKVYNTWQ